MCNFRILVMPNDSLDYIFCRRDCRSWWKIPLQGKFYRLLAHFYSGNTLLDTMCNSGILVMMNDFPDYILCKRDFQSWWKIPPQGKFYRLLVHLYSENILLDTMCNSGILVMTNDFPDYILCRRDCRSWWKIPPQGKFYKGIVLDYPDKNQLNK
jgi:hypothetical protein